MGLPEINISFTGKATTAVQRSAMGIVALIIKDDTPSFASIEYKDVSEIDSTNYTEANLDYIKKTLEGSPSKVIVEVLSTSAEDYSAALTRLASKKFNYLAVPGIASDDVTDIATWVKAKRTDNHKKIKAVLPNSASDDEGIINFVTDGIVIGETTYSASDYTGRIAGILAGLPFTQSATYYVLSEVTAITESATPDDDIDAGKLILINDGENIKIGRAVNSLTTTTATKTEDFKKIKVVDVMDMIVDDIRETFNDNYVGKVPNTYDNQVLFFTSVNAYFKGLAFDSILDPTYNNYSTVDVDAQRLAWESIGTDTTDWDEQKIKNMSFKSNVYAKGNVKIVDAMEDLDFEIYI